MTQIEFYQQICKLKNNFENKDLETYLLSLLNLVELEKNKDLTADLLLKHLQNAFISEPAEFKEEWLNIVTASGETIISNKITTPKNNTSIDEFIDSDKSGIDYSITVLHFQISELHKMKGKQLDDDMRFFGIASETGNR